MNQVGFAVAVSLFAVSLPGWAASQPIAMPGGVQPAKRVVAEQPVAPKVVVQPAEQRKEDNNVKAATQPSGPAVGPFFVND